MFLTTVAPLLSGAPLTGEAVNDGDRLAEEKRR